MRNAAGTISDHASGGIQSIKQGVSNLGDVKMSFEEPKDDEHWLVPPKGATDGEPPWIDITFDLTKLGAIDTVACSAFVKLRVFMYWCDDRLIDWKEPEVPGALWGPLFNLHNSLGDMQVTQDEFILIDPKIGKVRRVFQYEGTIDNHMDLHRFPFDSDVIEIRFTSISRWSSNNQEHAGKCQKRVNGYRVRESTNPDDGVYIRTGIKTSSIHEFDLYGISTNITELPPRTKVGARVVLSFSTVIASAVIYDIV
jgi:hypothetical protein